MSTGHFSFPTAYDPHMHREEVITLARTTSKQQKNAGNKGNGDAKSNTTSPKSGMASVTPTSATKVTAVAPRRQKFVFADPVAFRYYHLE